MQKNIGTNIIAIVAISIFFVGGVARAQTNTTDSSSQKEAGITFPIPELGNCTSKDACKLYCSDQTHIEACVSFGESHGLMKSDEAALARTFATMKGPGGCRGEECKTYCDNPDHIDKCLAFAQEHGLIRAEDVKILKVIRESGGPGECKSETECRAYCSDGAHRNECQKFAEDNGFVARHQERTGTNEYGQQNQSGHHDEHLGENPRIQELLATTGGPGGCTSEDACRTYCSSQGHMNKCLQFGKDNGLMSQEEYDRAKKFGDMTGPGGCRGEECKTYCDDSAHSNECLKHAEEKGFISRDDADKARVFASKPGPGGCTGEVCKTYCADQSHHDECVSFAVQNGFMTQAETDRTQNITGPGGCIGETCRSYCEDSAHQDECMSFAKKHGTSDTHQFPPTGSGEYRNTTGPEGCKTPEECSAVCKNNPEQCNKDFQGQRGHPLPPQGMEHSPTSMTPEQQQKYDTYMQSHGGEQPGTPETYNENDRSGLDMQHQGQYPQQYQGQPEPSTPPYQNMTPEQMQMYQQYQKTGTSPATQPYQPSGTPTQPPPPSSIPAPSSYPTTPSSSYPSHDSYSPPPSSSYTPSPSSYSPPLGSSPPSMMSAPPPSAPPPSSPPLSAPTSGASASSFVASIFYIFSRLFRF